MVLVGVLRKKLEVFKVLWGLSVELLYYYFYWILLVEKVLIYGWGNRFYFIVRGYMIKGMDKSKGRGL